MQNWEKASGKFSQGASPETKPSFSGMMFAMNL